MKLFVLILLFFNALFFVACDTTELTGKDKEENTVIIQKEPSKAFVDIFTLAPAKNILLQDAQNQVALYDEGNESYYFKGDIAYPVTATVTSQTYIDVDYDNNITSSDLTETPLFKTTGLKSFCSEVNFLTSYYYDQKMDENNISIESYKEDIKTRFDIDICAAPLQNQANAITLFGIYNAIIKENSFESLDSVESEITKVEEFFIENLSFLTSIQERVKYYSFYDALLLLDKHKTQRADTGHKPTIPSLLQEHSSLVKSKTSIDVFDIVKYNDTLLLAAGHDELASTDTELESVVFANNVGLRSFGSTLDTHEYNNTQCLFLANAKVGVTVFTLNDSGFIKEPNTLTTYDDIKDLDLNKTVTVTFTDLGINNMNGYISLNQNKRLFGISTADKGYYLLNIKENFNNCSRSRQFTNEDFIIEGDTGSAMDAIFRDDGSYLYVAYKEKGLYGYKTDILEQQILQPKKQKRTETVVERTKKVFALKDAQDAYNLMLYNNDNELFITTDKGLLIYDVGSSRDELSYVSEYLSEGAQKDYYPAIDSFEDYIFITDGYMGVKVLKLNNSFHPMLCGVEYFAPNNNDYELAKTTSVKYDDGYLYVGVTSQGIAKLKLEDLLFKHCK